MRIISTTIFSILFCIFLTAQNFADKKYYLIDSLDFSSITRSDSLLVEKYMKIYHEAESDTLRLIIIDSLITDAYDEHTWTSYNDFQYDFILRKLQNIQNKGILKIFKEQEANCYNNYGFYYSYKGNINKALEFHKKSLAQRIEVNHYEGQANSNLNIGMLYENQGEVKLAKEFYKKAIDIGEKIGDKKMIARGYVQLGNLMAERKEYAKALSYYNSAIDMYNHEKYIFGLSNVYNNIGSVYKKTEDYTNAIKYLELAIEYRIELGDKNGLSSSYASLGETYKKIGNELMAKKYTQKSLQLALELNAPNRIIIPSKNLFLIFKEEGNYKKALELYELFIETRDTLNSEENQKAIIQDKIQIEYDKQKAIDDAVFEKEIALKEKEEQRQAIIIYFTIAIGIIVTILLYFVWVRLKDSRIQNKIIERQKAEVYIAHEILEEKNNEIIDSIIYAKRIQSAILPPQKKVDELLGENFILYKPKDIVAGDFYWIEQKKDSVCFAVADCTGHGVPGALVSVICNNGLNRSVREHNLIEPNEILNKTREIVVEEFSKSDEEVKDGMDIAICSIKGNDLKYSGAYNPLWIIRNNTKEIEEIKADKQPIGFYINTFDFTNHKTTLNDGDVVYLFSDGFADQFGGDKGKKYKSVNLKKLLISLAHLPMNEQQEKLNLAFDHWKGELDQLDDVCVMGYKHRSN